MKRTREKARPNAYLLPLTLSPGYIPYLLAQLGVHVEIRKIRRVSGASVSLSQRAERLKRDTRRGRAEVAPRSRRGRAEIAPRSRREIACSRLATVEAKRRSPPHAVIMSTYCGPWIWWGINASSSVMIIIIGIIIGIKTWR